MHLCTCVGDSEEGGDGEGAGEGGDTQEGASSLELMSLDTHRREVDGAHGEPRNVTRRNTNVNSDIPSQYQ
jgi:hypothetical protein